ncbi:cell filamentation protein Fic [Capnocytophaga sputigena]|nr:cell filamentation protein Fic [Capnocytophaga sputigena]
MNSSEVILYTTPKGAIKIEILFENETFWLTQKKLAELFSVEVNTINYHLKEIFKTKELEENSVIRKIRITANDGKKYMTNFYNLDAIIAVGYRVNSYSATQFRIWATNTLKEFIIKGFVLDSERLKQGKNFGEDYFDELLEKIREIRASERRFYQKITDIYAQGSIDYDPKAPQTQLFYQTVQNKLHWAITGYTASEIISKRANANLPNMGLTSWKNAPKGKILKSDINIAKNYLTEKELKDLEEIVSMYLDYAENQAKRKILMKMNDWIQKLDSFLSFNEYGVLKDAGKVSAEVAKQLALKEYSKFSIIQDKTYISDFDLLIKESESSNQL